jgi:hypothetical protein
MGLPGRRPLSYPRGACTLVLTNLNVAVLRLVFRGVVPLAIKVTVSG